MTADAHALLAELDGILAECELVASHLAISGSAHTARGAHGDLLSRLEAFRADLTKALEPKPMEETVGKSLAVEVLNRAAMWAAKPDGEPGPSDRESTD